MKKPCSYCGAPIPDSGVFGLPTYTDVPDNHKPDCTIREIMEFSREAEQDPYAELAEKCDSPEEFFERLFEVITGVLAKMAVSWVANSPEYREFIANRLKGAKNGKIHGSCSNKE